MAETLTMDRLGDTLSTVGESPLWAVDEQALYWVDIEGRRLHAWSRNPAPGQAQARQWTLAERPACIALHAQGGLVCALESSVVHLRFDAHGQLTQSPLALAQHAQAGMRFNDGRCDRGGRFWVGSMLMDMSQAAPVGRLYRMDGTVGLPSPPLAPTPFLLPFPLIVPNGLAFSPDGRTMYLSDSHPSVRQIWQFTLSDTGMPGARRPFVDMNLHPGRPDGAAVDSDGAYWCCANDAGLVHRFTPEGRLDRSIAVPAAKPSMCAFGGPQLDELYITSIRPPVPPAGQEATAGATFVCRPGVQGLAETPFRAPAR